MIAVRNLDDFYEEAHASSTFWNRPRYWLIFFSMGLANIGDSAELGCMGFLLTNADFKEDILKGDFAKKGAMFTGSIFTGMLVGGILTGCFGDQQGRKPTLLLGLALNTVSGFCAAISSTIYYLCACRFLSGLGIGAVLASLIPLATEISPTSKRGAYATIIHSFMPIGGIAVGGMAMFMLTKWELSWRLFVAACSLPSFLGFILVYLFVPESARYLAMKGRFQEATVEANYVAETMGMRDKMLQIEELQHFFTHCVDTNKKEMDKSYFDAFQEGFNGFKDLYSSNLRRSTISLQVLWFCIGSGASFGTWMLAIFEEVHIHRVYFTLFVFWSANIPGLISAGFLIDKLGRKKLLIICMTSSSLALLCFAMAAHVGADDSDIGIITTSFVFHAFSVMSWTTTGVFSSETFPTKVRTTGLGVCTASARIAAILSQYIDGALISTPGFLMAISAVPIMLGTCVLYFLEDTGNKALKDDIEQIEMSTSSSQCNNEIKTSFVLMDQSATKLRDRKSVV